MNDTTQTLRLLADFKQYYADFGRADLTKLTELYGDDVVFVDPVQETRGVAALTAYFAEVSEGLVECKFHFEDSVLTEDRGYFRWVMEYAHPKIRGGQLQRLHGTSYIEFDDKIHFHRDYYDMGEMLYEHIPLLRSVIGAIKRQMQR